MKKTTIYLPEELAFQISARAKRERRTEASLVRDALVTYLASTRHPLPSFVGMVSDSSFDASEDEAYLAEHWKPDW